jgi:hypothetical protein
MIDLTSPDVLGVENALAANFEEYPAVGVIELCISLVEGC